MNHRKENCGTHMGSSAIKTIVIFPAQRACHQGALNSLNLFVESITIFTRKVISSYCPRIIYSALHHVLFLCVQARNRCSQQMSTGNACVGTTHAHQGGYQRDKSQTVEFVGLIIG